MTTQRDFILTSDFPALKNDANNSPGTTIVVPGSQVITGAGSYLQSADVVIGQQGALVRGRISASLDSNGFYVTQVLGFTRTGSLGTYTVFCLMFHVSATTVRCQIYIPNPYGSALTTQASAETYIFYFNTLITPFS